MKITIILIIAFIITILTAYMQYSKKKKNKEFEYFKFFHQPKCNMAICTNCGNIGIGEEFIGIECSSCGTKIKRLSSEALIKSRIIMDTSK